MTQTPTYAAGIDVAKDRLDVMLWPSGEYAEATNDERAAGGELLFAARWWSARNRRR